MYIQSYAFFINKNRHTLGRACAVNIYEHASIFLLVFVIVSETGQRHCLAVYASPFIESKFVYSSYKYASQSPLYPRLPGMLNLTKLLDSS